MCAYSNCRNEFLVIINGYVEFNPTVRGLKGYESVFSFHGVPDILACRNNILSADPADAFEDTLPDRMWCHSKWGS